MCPISKQFRVNGLSKSTLKIYDFKVKEVPVLAKILTLASLQGIADLLTGEGIRFNEFEMDYESTNNLTKINEIYAIGPAISMLMEGYIEKNKLISLRGTLVPATTVNKTIAKIPLIYFQGTIMNKVMDKLKQIVNKKNMKKKTNKKVYERWKE